MIWSNQCDKIDSLALWSLIPTPWGLTPIYFSSYCLYVRYIYTDSNSSSNTIIWFYFMWCPLPLNYQGGLFTS